MKEIKEMKEFLKKYKLLPVFEVVTEGQRAKQPKVKWTEKENRIYEPEKLTKVAYGLPCGKDTGVMVLDIDGDLTMLDKLCEAAGVEKEEIGKTLWVETANGGLHIYFKYREGLNNKTRFFGTCDFKTDGGYVIAPLSFIENKQKKMAQYKPLNYNPITIIPEKLYNFIKNPRKSTPQGGNKVRLEDLELEWYKETLRGMREGDGRNVALNRRLYWWAMQKHIEDEGELKEALIKEAREINEEYFKDQLPQAEVEKIVNSVIKGVMEDMEEKNAAIKNFTLEPQKDYGHALVLSDLFKNKYRWVVEWGKWIEYKNGVWVSISSEKVAKDATDTLHRYYTHLMANAQNRSERDELIKKIKDVWVYSRIIGALNFLKGFPGIMTLSQELDAIPEVLNLENGTLDLKTFTLRPHRPEDLLTKQVKAKWNTEAKKDEWLKHLNLCLPNKNIQREIQRELGLALTGVSLEEVLPIWYGTGANGKSTTLKVVMEVMGDYAQMAAPRLLIKSKYERHTTELAELQGRRLIFSTETGENGELDEEKMKWLTGGERIRARFMRQDNFEFPRTWIVFLVTNYKPAIRGTDEGTWRRIRLVPWEEVLPPDKRMPQEEIVKLLLEERDGILQWIVEGLKDWKEDHRWKAEEVLIATEKYREEEDVLREFLNERCEFKRSYSVEVGELYSEYLMWCQENGEDPKSKIEVGKLLRKRGLHQKRYGHERERKWVGIRIIHQEES